MSNLLFRKGFTVVELMLYMGLLAIFLTVMTQIFVASLDVQLESESTSSVEQDGKFILSRLTYDIAQSTSIIEPSVASPTSNTLTLIANDITYQYQLTGENLTLTDDSGLNQLNSVHTTISDLEFIRRGNQNGKLTISISFVSTSMIERPSGPETRTFQTTVGTR